MQPPSKYALVNMTEVFVKEKVLEMMETYGVCQCEKCYMDVCAMVLNSVKPQYVTTLKGSLLSKLDGMNRQYNVDVTIDIVKAIEHIKEFPNH